MKILKVYFSIFFSPFSSLKNLTFYSIFFTLEKPRQNRFTYIIILSLFLSPPEIPRCKLVPTWNKESEKQPREFSHILSNVGFSWDWGQRAMPQCAKLCSLHCIRSWESLDEWHSAKSLPRSSFQSMRHPASRRRSSSRHSGWELASLVFG